MATIDETLNDAWKIHQAGQVEEAERVYRGVLAQHPTHASAWCFLGMAYHDQDRFDDAVGAYLRSLELRPRFEIALNNLGNSYRLLRRLPEAVEAFDRAIAIKPSYLVAYKNKATSLCWEGRVAEALATYEEALKLAPDDPDIHKHLGILRLLLGDFAGGWPEYEWRWKTGEIKLPSVDLPKWDGSSLDGKTILLTPEQGLGDSIQFIRYAQWLKQRYQCRVLFNSPKALKPLLASCAGIDGFVDDLKNVPPCDCFAPLLHVPSVLLQAPADFPAEVPYLTAEATQVEAWREKLKDYPGRKIGIVWGGSPSHQANSMRSIPLAEFVPLLRLSGATLFSLQKGEAAAELNSLAGRLEIVDLGSKLDEGTGAFIETAGLLKNLDLLITCDTSIAHVAGALGVPVWVVLCNVPDWRWLSAGDKTPWYPTMRLFRQQSQSDWAPVMEQVADALPREFPDVSYKRPDEYHVLTSGFNRLTRTRQGLMLYNRNDQYIGRSIDQYGEFSPGEADLLKQAVKPGWTVVEAGANIGAHTLLISRLVGPRGAVHAFEPQRVVFQTLCANLALNSASNAQVYCAAVGEKAGTITVPALDYTTVNNFGGLPLGGPPIGGVPGEAVPVMTIDSLNLAKCQFLKADVEGMELAALKGAKQTIERCHPILYVENDRPELSPPLIEFLFSLGYKLYWHFPPLYSPSNFYRNAKNEFGKTVSVNMLGLHSSVKSEINGLMKIESVEADWRKVLNQRRG